MTRKSGWSAFWIVMVLSGCGGGSGSAGSDPSAGAGADAGATSNRTDGGSSGGSVSPVGLSNAVPVVVNSGPPAANGGTFNIPYVTLTVCVPGTSKCATISDVLVDTGSSGLRIMASALARSGLTLAPLADPNRTGHTLAECLPFADGYTWGALAVSDVYIGSEEASGATINIIDDNASYAPAAPTSCSGNGKSLSSVAAFSANGVLGVGLFDQDCGISCANCSSFVNGCNSGSDVYYSCGGAAATCAFAQVPMVTQVRNPVALFSTDNNGIVLELPAIAAGGAPSASGTLVFGIGTQSNNQLGGATVLTTDSSGNITTIFRNHTLTWAFLDSGSNGLYFDDHSIPNCHIAGNAGASEFYCPTATLSLSALNQGTNGNTSSVSFQIASLRSINKSYYAVDDLGGSGPAGLNGSYFDWGLPFFYGRNVYAAIENAPAGPYFGPFFAY